ncbi:cell division control protein 45 homolog [Bacillus rossius redtenbacheri]|uniref:cell division control protein 45 homolog n=1 Tax=Bacillus rossius redtenbacheri TaxID=93214 RepID=UPI002FDC93FE
MYVEDLKKDFYNVLVGKRILLLVNYDIDAICACKILLHLLHFEHVLYTLVPVQGLKDMQDAFDANPEVKLVVLVNCGGTVDVVEALQPAEDVVLFVADSHRPTDVCNVYSSGQVRLLGRPEDDEGVPSFEDLFRDDDDDDGGGGGGSGEEEEAGEEGGAGESRANKRLRLDEQALMRRRARRLWAEQRNKLLFDYSQFSYYGRSSAALLFELAWKLSKDSTDLLWWAVVGVTEQAVLGKVENQRYVLATGELQNHASRLAPPPPEDEEGRAGTAARITYDRDLRLALYRHWTVEASLRHSWYTACKLRMWTLRGEKRLFELLAEMGLPLAQSRQKFRAMDLNLRQEFRGAVEKLADKYGLEDIVHVTFTLQYGFGNCYCASDVVYAMLAVLESPAKDRSGCERFMAAMDCLSRARKDLLDEGIEQAKQLLVCVSKQVQSVLGARQVVCAGPFVYVVLQEGAADVRPFSRPHCLALLARFVLRAYVATSRNRRAPALPIVASAPLDAEGTCLVLGAPPLAEDSPRSFFGKAFEQAAVETRSRVSLDYFDTSVIQLKVEDRPKFFDALTTLLA